MARVTNKLYLDRCRFLAFMWRDFRQVFALLRAASQRHAYDYFQPHMNLTDTELIEHRKRIDLERPGLAAAAGRDFAVIHSAFTAAHEQSYGNVFLFNQLLHGFAQPGSVRRYQVERQHAAATLSISAVRKPEPDLEALRRLIFEDALERAQDELGAA